MNANDGLPSQLLTLFLGGGYCLPKDAPDKDKPLQLQSLELRSWIGVPVAGWSDVSGMPHSRHVPLEAVW